MSARVAGMFVQWSWSQHCGLKPPKTASQAYGVSGLAGDDDLRKGAAAVNDGLAEALDEHLLKLAFQGLIEAYIADRRDSRAA